MAIRGVVMSTAGRFRDYHDYGILNSPIIAATNDP